jgi:ABC-2 type transport system permease protein
MTLWRVEWLRLVRTRRWLALAGVFLFFGLLGPLTARYMDAIVGRLAAGVEVRLPPPTPVDGIVQYMSNAGQIGLLVLLALAASALAFDARPELGAFYRTRVGHARELVIPRYAVMTLAAWGAFLLGTLAAWYQSVVLLGPLPVTGMLAGMAYVCLYLAFAVAVVAAATALVRGVLAATGLAIAVLLGLAVLGILPALREWLPGALLGALTALAAGGDAGAYLPAAAVTVAATAALVAVAGAVLQRREA